MRLNWIPNVICIARVVLVVPIVVFLAQQAYLTAVILIGVAGLSDAVDGFLARQFQWRTRLGSILDPAADKLLATSVFLTLAYLGLIPLSLAVLVVLRDIVIVGGAAAYQWLVAPLEVEPSFISRINTTGQFVFVGLTLTSAAFAWPPAIVVVVAGAAVVFTSITSGLDYVLDRSRQAWPAGRRDSIGPRWGTR